MFLTVLMVVLSINVFFIPAHVAVLQEPSDRWGTYLLLILFVLSLCAAVFTGFLPFPSLAIALLAFPGIACLSCVILIVNRHKVSQIRRRFYWVGGLLVASMQCVLPWLGHLAVQHTCDIVNTQRGERIIVAIEQYHQDQSRYPAELSILVPAYLPQLPSPTCGAGEFLIFSCKSQEAVLAYRTHDGLGLRRYAFTTKQWSSIDTLDFDRCAYLE